MIAQCPPCSRNMLLGGEKVLNTPFAKAEAQKCAVFFMAEIADVLKTLPSLKAHCF